MGNGPNILYKYLHGNMLRDEEEVFLHNWSSRWTTPTLEDLSWKYPDAINASSKEVTS